MRVGLFVTCLVDLMRPRIGLATLSLLEAAGCTVVVPSCQTCCGQMAYHAGDVESARRLAIKLLDEFESCEYLVLPSGACTSLIRRHYAELVSDDGTQVRRMTALAAKTFELSEFLVEILHVEQLPGNFCGNVTYHDSCTGLRQLGIKKQPRELLGRLSGVTLTEMPEAEECCGFGGAFSVKFGDISAAIAERKCHNIQTSGASAVVGGDLGCLLNIEGRLRRMGDGTTQVLHLAEVLADPDETAC